jgi:hypothetical protein
MSQNQKQIEKLSSLPLDLDKFYVITLYPQYIRLQGECTAYIKRQCEQAGFIFLYDGDYLEAKKDGVEITLTF